MMRALTYWPEWCATFPGVRLTDGTASPLDKGVENRPMAPWSTIAPDMHGPGPWVAMHAGKCVGGKATYSAMEAGMVLVFDTAEDAGWRVVRTGWSATLYEPNHGRRWVHLHPGRIVRSAIVAMFRVVHVSAPGVGEGRPWRFADRYGWAVDVCPLTQPVPCSGAQGLWTVPPDIEAMVSAQLQGAPTDPKRTP